MVSGRFFNLEEELWVRIRCVQFGGRFGAGVGGYLVSFVERVG